MANRARAPPIVDGSNRPFMIPYGILMGITLLPALLLSIGLPNIPGLFIARVQVDPHTGKDLAHGIDEFRVRDFSTADEYGVVDSPWLHLQFGVWCVTLD